MISASLQTAYSGSIQAIIRAMFTQTRSGSAPNSSKPTQTKIWPGAGFLFIALLCFLSTQINFSYAQAPIPEKTKPEKASAPDEGPSEPSEDDGTGKAAGTASGKTAAKKAPPPVIGPLPKSYMGWVGWGLSILRGTYNDSQENQTTGRKNSLEGVALKGYRLEYERLTKRTKIGGELRLETPDHTLWTKRSTFVGYGGYVLPWLQITAITAGIFAELNRFEYQDIKSQDVTKVDQVGPFIGIDTKQAFFRTAAQTTFFGVLRYHLVNFNDRPNAVTELEASLGSATLFGRIMAEGSVGVLRQKFSGTHSATEEDPFDYSISGNVASTYLRLGLWL